MLFGLRYPNYSCGGRVQWHYVTRGPAKAPKQNMRCNQTFSPRLSRCHVATIQTSDSASCQITQLPDNDKLSVENHGKNGFKNTANFDENGKNHDKITTKKRHQITGPKTIIAYSL